VLGDGRRFTVRAGAVVPGGRAPTPAIPAVGGGHPAIGRHSGRIRAFLAGWFDEPIGHVARHDAGARSPQFGAGDLVERLAIEWRRPSRLLALALPWRGVTPTPT
jgi:hypothetical protein